MSVLIRGMEMPKDCGHCQYNYINMSGYVICEMLHKQIVLEQFGVRFDHCPFVEVPTSHGDLVDRSELLAEYDRQHKGPAGGARRIMEQAKAVIKAEGGKE